MSTTVTIPEITYNIDDLTSPGDPVPLDRSPDRRQEPAPGVGPGGHRRDA